MFPGSGTSDGRSTSSAKFCLGLRRWQGVDGFGSCGLFPAIGTRVLARSDSSSSRLLPIHVKANSVWCDWYVCWEASISDDAWDFHAHFLVRSGTGRFSKFAVHEFVHGRFVLGIWFGFERSNLFRGIQGKFAWYDWIHIACSSFTEATFRFRIWAVSVPLDSIMYIHINERYNEKKINQFDTCDKSNSWSKSDNINIPSIEVVFLFPLYDQ